jgi:hypothetical protein
MHPKAALFCCYSFYRNFREQFKKKIDGTYELRCKIEQNRKIAGEYCSTLPLSIAPEILPRSFT